MNDYCPLDLECVIDESVQRSLSNRCANIHTCFTWASAWELPYSRYDNVLIVDFLENYNDLQNELSDNPITSQYDWTKYFAEYGFAEAVDLPYFFNNDGTIMRVFIGDNNIYREEMQKTGYANAIGIPLSRRKEFYSAEGYEGFSYFEVDLFLCDDEAINAFNAGYADAVAMWDCFSNLDV